MRVYPCVCVSDGLSVPSALLGAFAPLSDTPNCFVVRYVAHPTHVMLCVTAQNALCDASTWQHFSECLVSGLQERLS